MGLSSIREDEEIIKELEDMDENFSAIKCTLRELRLKIARIAQKNKEIVDDCKPWIKFFDVKSQQNFSPFSELQLNSLKFNDASHSPNNLNLSSPRNPFVEVESSELLNKSLCKVLKISMASSSSCTNTDQNVGNQKDPHSDSEDTMHDIVPFERDQLPEIFQNESDLIGLYNFIQEQGTVTLESVIERFRDIPAEKLEILMSFLCRKRFVKQKDCKISVEK